LLFDTQTAYLRPMAIRQITVPWTPGYDIGVGADLASGSPMNSPVKPDATPVDRAGGANIDMQIQRIHSTEDLEKALGIDVEASYGSAAFGSGVSARFSFAQKSKVQSSSLFMSVTARIELAFQSIDAPHLTDAAVKAAENPELFEQQYGNMFVRGLGRGGLFVGVLRVDTGSSEESLEISAELEGSYALFSASASPKFTDVQKKYKNEVFVRQYQEGGPGDLRIDDPSNPLELLENANKFLDSFAKTPDEVAVPYSVILAPTTIAIGGPTPPNAAQIQQAQDVLIYCAKRRSVFLDHLNLLDFISDNPGKFTFTAETPIESIRAAAKTLQVDLDLIADCASAAINDRASAKRPELYAQENGTTFPTAILPDPLPVAKASVGTVEVPDFSVCTTEASCRDMAAASKLAVTFTSTGAEGAFQVLGFDPPKGSPVDVGSTVTIMIPPAPQPADPSPVVTPETVHIVGTIQLPEAIKVRRGPPGGVSVTPTPPS
jgi:hypothetical protein